MDVQRQEDREIAGLARDQHGLVTRAQLRARGIERGAIQHRPDCGRLHVVHRGVYAVGHRALSVRATWMAAVLAAGPGAALSHHHAAALWEVRETRRSVIHVTAPTQRRSRPGLRIHHSPLPPDETTTHHDVPVTTVSRTLLDLASVLPPHQLERAVNEAEYLELSDPLSLDALLLRYPTRQGTPAIRRLLQAARIGRTRSRSDFEASFIAFLDALHLPRPDLNVPIRLAARTVLADAVWREHSLIVELDVTATHGGERSFHADRARDRELQALGWRTTRITDRHLTEDRPRLAADLRALLKAGRASTSRSVRRPAAR